MTITERIRSGWTVLKFLRVGLGGLILYSSIESGNTGGIVLGAFFTLFSLLTDGVCCMGGSCNSPVNKNNFSIPENIDYEELGAK